MIHKWEFDVGELIRVTYDDQTNIFEAYAPIGGQWVPFEDMVQKVDDINDASFIAFGWAECLAKE